MPLSEATIRQSSLSRALLRVALHALEFGDVAQVYRMLKWAVRFMTDLTFEPGQIAKLSRMFEGSDFGIHIRGPQ